MSEEILTCAYCHHETRSKDNRIFWKLNDAAFLGYFCDTCREIPLRNIDKSLLVGTPVEKKEYEQVRIRPRLQQYCSDVYPPTNFYHDETDFSWFKKRTDLQQYIDTPTTKDYAIDTHDVELAKQFLTLVDKTPEVWCHHDIVRLDFDDHYRTNYYGITIAIRQGCFEFRLAKGDGGCCVIAFLYGMVRMDLAAQLVGIVTSGNGPAIQQWILDHADESFSSCSKWG